METSKSGSSKLIVMSILEPKDELDEVKFLLKWFVYASIRSSFCSFDLCLSKQYASIMSYRKYSMSSASEASNGNVPWLVIISTFAEFAQHPFFSVRRFHGTSRGRRENLRAQAAASIRASCNHSTVLFLAKILSTKTCYDLRFLATMPSLWIQFAITRHETQNE